MKIVNLSCIMFMYLVICCKKIPCFFMTNRRMEKIYGEGSGRILRWPNNFLHESLLLLPVIILIILFCILKLWHYVLSSPKTLIHIKLSYGSGNNRLLSASAERQAVLLLSWQNMQSLI